MCPDDRLKNGIIRNAAEIQDLHIVSIQQWFSCTSQTYTSGNSAPSHDNLPEYHIPIIISVWCCCGSQETTTLLQSSSLACQGTSPGMGDAYALPKVHHRRANWREQEKRLLLPAPFPEVPLKQALQPGRFRAVRNLTAWKTWKAKQYSNFINSPHLIYYNRIFTWSCQNKRIVQTVLSTRSFFLNGFSHS